MGEANPNISNNLGKQKDGLLNKNDATRVQAISSAVSSYLPKGAGKSETSRACIDDKYVYMYYSLHPNSILYQL